ncbi:menaquinone biosynthetic enzyme MqnA/MqnD family protein [Thermus sediminis]|uniref:menaquinone biosynthetic enzyme MqnA/MqnD family protein n=1 Tax=Thermus sediminis TaxID=1761908 RepID=UPI000E3C355D|nr:menaquinone biosynthesis protein [Thermus sediminis]
MSYRLGLPPYANVAPLAHFLRPEGFTLFQAPPTALNRMLLEGELDLSLASSLAYLEHQDQWGLLPDFSVAVLGPVYSVNLFHRVPLEDLKRVALTGESATSVALLRLLLEERGVKPCYERAEGELELLQDYEGVLLIGDRAVKVYARLLRGLPETPMDLPTRFGEVAVTDLAMAWFRRTRLPFVFAVWAYRRESPPPKAVVQALRRARLLGLGRLEEVAQKEGRRLSVHPALLLHYLWNFRYHLEEPDRLGLKAFAEALGLPFRPMYYPE